METAVDDETQLEIFSSDFVPVARALLDRVVNHRSDFDSLSDEGESENQ